RLGTSEWNGGLLHHVAETGDRLHGSLESCGNFPVSLEILGGADAQAPLLIRPARELHRSRERIWFLQRVPDERRIRYPPCRHPRVTEPGDHLFWRRFAGKDSLTIDQAVRPLEADDAATCRRQSAGADGVRIDGRGAHTAGNGGGRSARRSARDV